VNGHHDVVHDLVTSEWSSIMGLQETKCDVFSDYDIMQLLGRGFDYYFLPMIQTHGGILLAWRTASWSASSISSRSYSLLTRMRQVADGIEWWLTTVAQPETKRSKPSWMSCMSLEACVQGLGSWQVTSTSSTVSKTKITQGLIISGWASSGGS
jgi:hypothetical protein